MVTALLGSAPGIAGWKADAQEQVQLRTLSVGTAENLSGVGSVTDAVLDRDGHLVLLDQHQARITITDLNFRYLTAYPDAVATPPGGFREPIALDILDDGRIAVLDRARGEVTILSIDSVSDSGREVRVDRVIPVSRPAEGFCMLSGDRMLVYGLKDGARLRLTDRDGATQASFADATSALSEMANDLVSQGRISCDSARQEALVTSRILARVEAFNLQSRTMDWMDVLAPVRPIVLRDRGSSVTIAAGPSGYSEIVSVFAHEGARVFQTRYRSRTDAVRADTVSTYLYSVDAGEWLPMRRDLPLLYHLGDTLALSVHQENGAIREVRLNSLSIFGTRQRSSAPREPRR